MNGFDNIGTPGSATNYRDELALFVSDIETIAYDYRITTGRYGGGALKFYTQDAFITINAIFNDDASDSYVIGFNIKSLGTSLSNYDIRVLHDSGYHIRFVDTAVYLDVANIGDIGGGVSGEWSHVQIEVSHNSAGNSDISVYVDGVLRGTDTLAKLSNKITFIGTDLNGTASVNGHEIDDLYIIRRDSSGLVDRPDHRVRIETIMPTGIDSLNNQWIANAGFKHAAVSGIPYDETLWIETDTSGNIQQFDFQVLLF